jgi:hypothetical protein
VHAQEYSPSRDSSPPIPWQSEYAFFDGQPVLRGGAGKREHPSESKSQRRTKSKSIQRDHRPTTLILYVPKNGVGSLAQSEGYDIFFFAKPPRRDLSSLMTYTADQLHDHSVGFAIDDMVFQNESRAVEFHTPDAVYVVDFEHIILLFDDVPRSFNTRVEELWGRAVQDSYYAKGEARKVAFDTLQLILMHPHASELAVSQRNDGFHNASNSCYLSILVQGILTTSSLWNLSALEPKETNFINKFVLLMQLMAGTMERGEKFSLSNMLFKEVYHCAEFQNKMGLRQQPIENLVSFFRQCLKSQYPEIDRLFQWHKLGVRRCKCGRSIISDSWLDEDGALNLKPTPGNVLKNQNLTLSGMVLQDHLSTLPCYRCPDCKTANTTVHETQIQWPRILVVTIQRLIHGQGPIIRIKNPFEVNRHEMLPLGSDGVDPM